MQQQSRSSRFTPSRMVNQLHLRTAESSQAISSSSRDTITTYPECIAKPRVATRGGDLAQDKIR